MHFAIEIKEENGECLKCGQQTIMISPMLKWRIDEDDLSKQQKQCPYEDLIDINEEVTAHYCTACEQVTAVWINT